MAIRIKPITEAEFTKMVIDLAKLNGFRVAHFRPARTKNGGWVTAMSGDIGFPDVIMARETRLIVSEIKVGNNRPTPEQMAWLGAFGNAGAEVYIWRPEDWDTIVKLLERP